MPFVDSFDLLEHGKRVIIKSVYGYCAMNDTVVDWWIAGRGESRSFCENSLLSSPHPILLPPISLLPSLLPCPVVYRMSNGTYFHVTLRYLLSQTILGDQS